MFVATDERDWRTLRGCLTDPFTLELIDGNLRLEQPW
jgi:hypothetical protein